MFDWVLNVLLNIPLSVTFLDAVRHFYLRYYVRDKKYKSRAKVILRG